MKSLNTNSILMILLASSSFFSSAASASCKAKEYYDQAREKHEITISSKGPLCSGQGACWYYSRYRAHLLVHNHKVTMYRKRAVQMSTGTVSESFAFQTDGPFCR